MSCGVYIHIPFCRSRCAYCDFTSSVDRFDPYDYTDALCAEIKARAPGFADSVYIGGGTPSVLPVECFSRIFETLRSVTEFSRDCEITTEANPDSFSEEFAETALSCGVNRLSLGVQSLSDNVLRAIGRRHDAATAAEAVKRAHARGFGNVSCDLMLGLPKQTTSDVLESVRQVVDWGVTHLSLYALTVEPGTPMYASGYRVDEDAASDCYDQACELLFSLGFERYEVSNFCRRGYECRHNLKYWRREPYVGLGAAAHSFDGISRSFNTSDIARYIAGDCDRRAQTVTARDALEECIMLGLRTRDGVDYESIAKICPEWESRVRGKSEELVGLGFIERTERGVRLTPQAYYVMNEVIVRLLPDE